MRRNTRRRVAAVVQVTSYFGLLLLLAGLVLGGSVDPQAPLLPVGPSSLLQGLSALEARALLQTGFSVLLLVPVVRSAAIAASELGGGNRRAAALGLVMAASLLVLYALLS